LSASQRQHRQALAAGAQHVGGADISGADRAHVRAAGGERDHQPERDRAEQVAENESERLVHTIS